MLSTIKPLNLAGSLASLPLHQAFFDAIADSDKKTPFASLPFPEMMAQIAQIGAKHNMYFAPVDVSKPIGERFG